MKLLIILFIISISGFLQAQTISCWPNSRGNDQLQGYTPVKFPQQIQLKWTYDADGIFKSAPVICNNKIVVGSSNGDLLCLDLSGKLLWKFKTDNGIEAPASLDDWFAAMDALQAAGMDAPLAMGEQWTALHFHYNSTSKRLKVQWEEPELPRWYLGPDVG